jgi:hypothetical protein
LINLIERITHRKELNKLTELLKACTVVGDELLRQNKLLIEKVAESEAYVEKFNGIRDALFELRNMGVTIEPGSGNFHLTFIPHKNDGNYTEYRKQINAQLTETPADNTVILRSDYALPVEWVRMVKNYLVKFDTVAAEIKKQKKINALIEGVKTK